jgi:hypothetical protein
MDVVCIALFAFVAFIFSLFELNYFGFSKMTTPTEILPFLYVGDSMHGTSIDVLKDQKITAVMNVSKYDYTSKFVLEPTFDYMWIKVRLFFVSFYFIYYIFFFILI